MQNCIEERKNEKLKEKKPNGVYVQIDDNAIEKAYSPPSSALFFVISYTPIYQRGDGGFESDEDE
jgi:hypothetical protein